MSTETITAARIRLDLTWDDDALAGIRLLWAEGATPTSPLSPQGKAMAEALARYAAGEAPNWPDVELADQGLSPFARTVLRTLRREAGPGQLLSYGGLAALAGRPGAARAVGRVMGANPWPLLVPCHRVVGSSGALTGFSGSGLTMKTYLLGLEGVAVAKGAVARP